MPALARMLALALIASVALAAPRFSGNSRHYELFSELTLDETRRLADHMDRVYDAYTRILSEYPVRHQLPARLYLFADQRSYAAHLDGVGFFAANTGGLFYARGDDAGLCAWVGDNDRRRLISTLQHEGLHYFAASRFGLDLPIWVNEGLAEYCGEAVLVGTRLELGLVPESRLLRLQQAVRERTLIPVDSLFRDTMNSWNKRVESKDPRANLQYDQAWALVQFFLHANGQRYAPALREYLLAVHAGADPASAEQTLLRAVGAPNTRALEQLLARYIASVEPDPLSAAIERLGFLGQGLLFLHEKGQRPRALDDLQRDLKRIDFRVITTSHNVIYTTSSRDDRLFQGPFERGKRSVLQILPNGRPDMPPEARITGLRASVRLTWYKGPGGKPVADIRFD